LVAKRVLKKGNVYEDRRYEGRREMERQDSKQKFEVCEFSRLLYLDDLHPYIPTSPV